MLSLSTVSTSKNLFLVGRLGGSRPAAIHTVDMSCASINGSYDLNNVTYYQRRRRSSSSLTQWTLTRNLYGVWCRYLYLV